jgi:carbamoyl-phosphate synthase small subunit
VLNRAVLVLGDGKFFIGKGFGRSAPRPEELSSGGPSGDASAGAAGAAGALSAAAGEVVFNTGMAGYHEILTDPSYTGQIVTMTYPLIGNYGADPRWNEGGPEKGTNRRAVKVSGFVVKDLYEGPVPAGRVPLDEFLASENITGITGIDTRKLTLHLRDKGTVSGLIMGLPEGAKEFSKKMIDSALGYLASFPDMEGQNLLGEVGTVKAETVCREGKKHFVLIDCGTKAGIIRELEALGVRVSILPSVTSPGEVLNLKPDGVLFSNGPGDPAVLKSQIGLARKLIDKVPVFGICLGHQIIALALGAKTYKLPFGHHGVNNPVVDLRDGRVYVTSQNHGFAVEADSLPESAKVWFSNANDKTVEGLYHTDRPVMSVQFHPEASPGPVDTRWIFREFLKKSETT